MLQAARALPVVQTEHENGDRCEVWYLPEALSAAEQARALRWLRGLGGLRRGEAFGRVLGREQRWFHEKGEDFCGGWVRRFPRWEPFLYDETLLWLQRRVQAVVRERLGRSPALRGCLVNRYQDGSDHIQLHRDEANQPLATVVGLSLGAQRTMHWRAVEYDQDRPRSCKLRPEGEAVTCSLAPGSLLVMAGATQQHWVHGIPPEPDVTAERYSLTFREC